MPRKSLFIPWWATILILFVTRHGSAAWNSSRRKNPSQSDHWLCQRFGELFSSSMRGDSGHELISCSNSRRTHRWSDSMDECRRTALLSWCSSKALGRSPRSIVIRLSFSGIQNVWSIRVVRFLSIFVKHFSHIFETIKPQSRRIDSTWSRAIVWFLHCTGK